ncbi:MAG TPA: DUF2309 domain-containing protein [Terriglobales bacterium]|nr:DUF2309 domain-containing protein [Terriglobales bacterium]
MSSSGFQRGHSLQETIDAAARLLPAQGPISVFIHHNTLHAFEDLPFEQAVEFAGGELDREPYLPEERYRDKLASGRIRHEEVDAVLGLQWNEPAASENIAGTGSRRALWRAILLHGIPETGGRELAWLLEETGAVKGAERLWRACLEAAARARPPRERPEEQFVRHRDLMRQSGGPDSDGWIHPPLIRFLAGYLDQGMGHWAMPARELGIHGCFLELYASRLAARCGAWARHLPHIVAEERSSGRDALASVERSLDLLGILAKDRASYLQSELLALRGWAGLVRQMEVRSDRIPVRELTVTLRGYLAVRLLFGRAALEAGAQMMGFRASLAELRHWLEERVPTAPRPSLEERAWPLFHVARLMECEAADARQWSADDVAAIERELDELNVVRRRRILHQAFERTVRGRFYGALTQHQPQSRPRPPAYQAIFCLDEREESFRRHLEEADRECETFGAAGYFNVAVYHQGAADAHPRPLCPAAIRPQHYIAEVGAGAVREPRGRQRAAGFLGYNVHVGSRRAFHGAVLMTLVGWMALIPLVLRVLFPWLASRWLPARAARLPAADTRLQLDRRSDVPPAGKFWGFTVREMADIVRGVLDDSGLGARLAPLVLIAGHGSTSLNNPHESAHDCGACGGGRGGPNARAFAQMANDARVRVLLADEKFLIPAGTWFVGAQRNTANNEVRFFDTDLIPASSEQVFERARAAVETARRQEARERCRRFDAVPQWYPPLAALAHVEGRAADLAQPRPEYGHATNAFCMIGRRARTRGLFLDRRAFLVSYDPELDCDGAILRRTLAAAIPVVAGINLEYYFSYVDPVGYGCGTKLPHNVTSLLGVMDGAQSDLRTGLPWQMVEIHEPVRLAVVVETSRERLAQAVAADPSLGQLARNRWIWLACLEASTIWELRSSGFAAHAPTHPLPVIIGDSATWYQGKSGFLSPASIVPA